MRPQHRMRRAAIATLVASATMALLAACGGESGSAANLAEAVPAGRALSDELGGAAVLASLSPEARDDWERLEWRDGVCWYTAPGWTLAVPAGDDPSDPAWEMQTAALNPAVEAHGVAPFGAPEQVEGLTIATATGPLDLTVELTSRGSISIQQPVDLGEVACEESPLPPEEL